MSTYAFLIQKLPYFVGITAQKMVVAKSVGVQQTVCVKFLLV